MRKLLLISAALAMMAGPATAADMLVKKAPPPRPVPVWSWTGFYIGGNFGGGWAQSDWFEDGTPTGAGGPAGLQDASVRASGPLGGGQIGFDYQSGWAVFGVQADADVADLHGTQQNCFVTFSPPPSNCTTDIKSLATVTGRIGAAFDRTLLYVNGGYAWQHSGLENPAPMVGLTAIAGDTRSGWTLGAGLEYAVAGNWSAFVQYNYMGFGTRDLLFVGVPPALSGNFTEDVRVNINVVKVGINYRFH